MMVSFFQIVQKSLGFFGRLRSKIGKKDRVNAEKSQLVPTKQIEFLGSVWTQRYVRRFPSVDKTIEIILHDIEHRTKPFTLKRAQQIAGYLNYYLSFAGRIYILITF